MSKKKRLLLSDEQPAKPCSVCGKNASYRGDKCNTCRSRIYVSNPERKAAILEKHKSRYRRLVSSGMCSAGCGNPAENGRLMCDSCARKNNVATGRRKRNLSECGKCRDCGKTAESGKKMCFDCSERAVSKHHGRYGLTRDEMVAIRALARVKSCAICGRAASESTHGVLSLDHSHTDPPVFRGLICGQCNAGLGYFFDSVDSLIMAAEYIEQTDPRYRTCPEAESKL